MGQNSIESSMWHFDFSRLAEARCRVLHAKEHPGGISPARRRIQGERGGRPEAAGGALTRRGAGIAGTQPRR
eukprot:8719242-Alexandrium_andersonii.AAC.1